MVATQRSMGKGVLNVMIDCTRRSKKKHNKQRTEPHRAAKNHRRKLCILDVISILSTKCIIILYLAIRQVLEGRERKERKERRRQARGSLWG